MAKPTKFYGKVITSEGKEVDFMFSLKTLIEFITTHDFIEIRITKKKKRK